MKYGLAVNIHDINNNAIVEIDVVLQGESESAWRLSVLLTIQAVAGDMLKGLAISIVFMASAV